MFESKSFQKFVYPFIAPGVKSSHQANNNSPFTITQCLKFVVFRLWLGFIGLTTLMCRCHLVVTHGAQYIRMVVNNGILCIIELALIIILTTGITVTIQLEDWRMASTIWNPVTFPYLLMNNFVVFVFGVVRWRRVVLWLRMIGLCLRWRNARKECSCEERILLALRSRTLNLSLSTLQGDIVQLYFIISFWWTLKNEKIPKTNDFCKPYI